MIRPLTDLLIGAVVICAAAFVFGAPPVRSCEMVVASWYGQESGSRTANGERFTGEAMTAAHKTLAFGTKLRVKYRGKSVVVRINDRGPYIRGRSLDLSKAAARKIGLIPAGVGTVCVTRLR